jgi:hypothetical protein
MAHGTRATKVSPPRRRVEQSGHADSSIDAGRDRALIVRGRAAAAALTTGSPRRARPRGQAGPPLGVGGKLCRLEPPLTDRLFLREVLYGAGIAAVEWFERLLPAAGDEVLLVTRRAGAGDSRSIRLEAHGPRHEARPRAALGT